jgi:hypothetical protein
MASEHVTVICSSCEARYRASIEWVESAAEFDCSCGARLKPNTHDLFPLRHNMGERPEIMLQPY